ncbi:hypothetical protein [Bacillus sp. Marseille-P3661]|nr:hypothetical protein [Bacillus sp. Marseille-P3661]
MEKHLNDEKNSMPKAGVVSEMSPVHNSKPPIVEINEPIKEGNFKEIRI